MLEVYVASTATIDYEMRAIEQTCHRAGEKCNNFSNFLWSTETAPRISFQYMLECFWLVDPQLVPFTRHGADIGDKNIDPTQAPD
jgi:hypothetical protein